MNRTLLATLIGTVALAGSAVARPEQNAFINRPANTIPELVAQLRSDPVVMDRFMRHFSMSRSEVLAYVGSLRLGVIPTSATYTIYSVPEDGRIKVHKSFFKAGTPAFVNAQGQPILRIKCGNPFVAGPKFVAITPTPTVSSLPPTPTDVVATELTSEPMLTSVYQPADVTEYPPLTEVIETPTLPTDSTTIPGGPQIIAPLAALAGLGGALSVAGSGRSSSNPTPVPEPATLLVVGAGVAAVARRRRRK